MMHVLHGSSERYARPPNYYTRVSCVYRKREKQRLVYTSQPTRMSANQTGRSAGSVFCSKAESRALPQRYIANWVALWQCTTIATVYKSAIRALSAKYFSLRFDAWPDRGCGWVYFAFILKKSSDLITQLGYNITWSVTAAKVDSKLLMSVNGLLGKL